MATSPEEPFRFLDLPPELRHVVYQALFDPRHLFVDYACWCARVPGPARHGLNEPMPDILLVCKSIRQEAVPFFSASLTPVACKPDPRTGSSRVPAHYLRHSKTAFINDRSKEMPTMAQLPSLQTLIIHFCWDFDIFHDDIMGAPWVCTTSTLSDQQIVSELLGGLKYSAIDDLLKDDKTKESLPASVFLECELVACCPDCGGLGWYDNILIDMKRAPPELLSKVRKGRLAHQEACRWFKEEDENVQAQEEQVELVGRWADGGVVCARDVEEGWETEQLAEYERAEAEGTLDEW